MFTNSGYLFHFEGLKKKKVSFDQELIYKMSALFYDDFFAKLKVVKRKHCLLGANLLCRIYFVILDPFNQAYGKI